MMLIFLSLSRWANFFQCSHRDFSLPGPSLWSLAYAMGQCAQRKEKGAQEKNTRGRIRNKTGAGSDGRVAYPPPAPTSPEGRVWWGIQFRLLPHRQADHPNSKPHSSDRNQYIYIFSNNANFFVTSAIGQFFQCSHRDFSPPGPSLWSLAYAMGQCAHQGPNQFARSGLWGGRGFLNRLKEPKLPLRILDCP